MPPGRVERRGYPQVCDYLRSLLLPENIVVTFNGDRLHPRSPLRTFEASLDTLVADEEGVMRPRVRKTQVSIFEVLPSETPTLYEMGLPVVETGDKWHVNIGQKVPLNRDRDNVRPAFLQPVRVAVLNAAFDLLTVDDEATAGWRKLAGSDQRCSDEAIKHLIRLRFGEKVASPDPSDTEAMQRLAELIRRSERKESGLADPFEESRKRPLGEHLDDYRRFLGAEGNTVKYVAQTTANIQAILDGCGFQRIGDVTSEKVAEFLHGLRRDPVRPVLPVGKAEFTPAELTAALGGVRPAKLARVIAREKLDAGRGNGPKRTYPRATVERLQDIFCRGVSVCTSNSYLTAIKSFSRWLLERERTDRDRPVSLSRLNAKTDRRHHRRALDETELSRLLASASASAVTLQGLTGRDRSMVYMLAMSTGLRASELASLTPGGFALETECPAVTVRAAYTKNRLEAEQPLPADVAAAFREYLRGRAAAAALWPGQWNRRAAEMLRADLDGAGIAYRDADGNVADFHSLRASYISLLVRQGANPKVAQTLARHSDPRLTFAVYAKSHIHDQAAAVEGLPINLPGCHCRRRGPMADQRQSTSLRKRAMSALRFLAVTVMKSVKTWGDMPKAMTLKTASAPNRKSLVR